MKVKSDRRGFLRAAAWAGISVYVVRKVGAQQAKSPNERIQFGCIGIGGKGSSDSADAARFGDVVAICDIDENRLNAAASRFEGAKRYTDFRKMLEENEGKIDAVTVSTADHTHALAGVMAMRMKMHCFCQKPLTRTVYEARLMGEVARSMGVATQMGNQGTATNGLRRAAAIVKAGALGRVSEVHVWTNRPIWPQGGNRPDPKPCPPHVKWDLWLGPAPVRPYADGYHPFAWRGYWDFGTGALGDMACHTLNMPFAALDLRDPVAMQAETSGHNGDSFPKWSVITYEFPARGDRPALKLVWYDGGKRPDKALLDGREPAASGALIIGEKGKLYSPGDYCDRFEILGDVAIPDVTFKRSPGHFEEWIEAIKGGEPAMSNFPDYASPLTETVLLGNLAVWVAAVPGVGPRVEWDAANMRVTNIEGLETLVKPVCRPGWELG